MLSLAIHYQLPMATYCKLCAFLTIFITGAASASTGSTHGARSLEVGNISPNQLVKTSWRPKESRPEEIYNCSCNRLAESNLCDLCTKPENGRQNSEDRKYPLTPPIPNFQGLKYRIGIIADLDTSSKESNGKYHSYFKKGYLQLQFNQAKPHLSKVSVDWDLGNPQVILSGLNDNGRGMELSELFTFNNRIYSCDDRTGVVFAINTKDTESQVPIPWIILNDGNGTVNPKGFKCEWATIKKGKLWIGSWGKVWTDDSGKEVNHNLQWVKKISESGEIENFDWKNNYDRLSSALGIEFPGYVVHEAVGWSDIWNKWMFLPRRVSRQPYNATVDEHKGSNVMILADEHFENIQGLKVGKLNPSHGFSSFKWIPGTGDELVVALKTVEVDEKTETYLMVFTMGGEILIPETKVGDMKYEGIEFL